MKRNQIIGVVILLIIVGAGSFYAGKSMTSSTSTTASARGAYAAGGAAGFAGRAGRTGIGGGAGGATIGQIVSSSNGSIAIQMQNSSSSEIVLITPTTQILKTVSGTSADLSTGATVTVTGTTNSDGSLTATSVQIRPAGMNFPAGSHGTVQ